MSMRSGPPWSPAVGGDVKGRVVVKRRGSQVPCSDPPRALPSPGGPARAGGGRRRGRAVPASRASTPYPEQPFVPATSARAFGDSVGVNVRLSWIDTAYGDFGAVRARLRELGVRHINDGFCGACEYQLDRMKRLAADGITSSVSPSGLTEGSAALQWNLQVIRDRVREAVDSVQAPNEPDISGDPQWVEHTRAYQVELYARVKGDPALAHLPVIGPSIVNRELRPLRRRPVGLPRSREPPSVPGRYSPAVRHGRPAADRRHDCRQQAVGRDRGRLPQRSLVHGAPPRGLGAGHRDLHAPPRARGLPGRHRAHVHLPTAGPVDAGPGAGARHPALGELVWPPAMEPIAEALVLRAPKPHARGGLRVRAGRLPRWVALRLGGRRPGRAPPAAALGGRLLRARALAPGERVGQGRAAGSLPRGRPARGGPGRAGVARTSLQPRRLRCRAPALDGPTEDPGRPGGRPGGPSPDAARSADLRRAPGHARGSGRSCRARGRDSGCGGTWWSRCDAPLPAPASPRRESSSSRGRSEKAALQAEVGQEEGRWAAR